MRRLFTKEASSIGIIGGADSIAMFMAVRLWPFILAGLVLTALLTMIFSKH